MLPEHFCWTRFGTEAGEDISSILARKELERRTTGGLFLWGIGTSVGPAMRELVMLEKHPMVVFSPMRSKPKPIDVAPTGITQWTYAQDLEGNEWPLPDGVRVTSRQSSESGHAKRAHFALVCHSSMPLVADGKWTLAYEDLVNLQSGNKLGASQVTAVVKRISCDLSSNTSYPIAFTASLTYPYFVRLESPIESTVNLSGRRHHHTLHQGLSRLAA